MDIDGNIETIEYSDGEAYYEGLDIFTCSDGFFTGRYLDYDMSGAYNGGGLIFDIYKEGVTGTIIVTYDVNSEYLILKSVMRSDVEDGTELSSEIKYLSRTVTDPVPSTDPYPDMVQDWECVSAVLYHDDETSELSRPAMEFTHFEGCMFSGEVTVSTSEFEMTQSFIGISIDRSEVYYGNIMNDTGQTLRFYLVGNTLYYYVIAYDLAICEGMSVAVYTYTCNGDEPEPLPDTEDVTGTWVNEYSLKNYNDGESIKAELTDYLEITYERSNVVLGVRYLNGSYSDFTMHIITSGGGTGMMRCNSDGSVTQMWIESGALYAITTYSDHVLISKYVRSEDIEDTDIVGHWYAMSMMGFSDGKEFNLDINDSVMYVYDFDIYGIKGSMAYGKLSDYAMTGVYYNVQYVAHLEFDNYTLRMMATVQSDKLYCAIEYIKSNSDGTNTIGSAVIYYSKDFTSAVIEGDLEEYLGEWTMISKPGYSNGAVVDDIPSIVMDFTDVNGTVFSGKITFVDDNGKTLGSSYCTGMFTYEGIDCFGGMAATTFGNVIEFTVRDNILTSFFVDNGNVSSSLTAYEYSYTHGETGSTEIPE
jgi:hypothetical protein